MCKGRHDERRWSLPLRWRACAVAFGGLSCSLCSTLLLGHCVASLSRRCWRRRIRGWFACLGLNGAGAFFSYSSFRRGLNIVSCLRMTLTVERSSSRFYSAEWYGTRAAICAKVVGLCGFSGRERKCPSRLPLLFLTHGCAKESMRRREDGFKLVDLCLVYRRRVGCPGSQGSARRTARNTMSAGASSHAYVCLDCADAHRGVAVAEARDETAGRAEDDAARTQTSWAVQVDSIQLPGFWLWS